MERYLTTTIDLIDGRPTIHLKHLKERGLRVKDRTAKRMSMKNRFMKISSFGPLEDIPCPNCQSENFDIMANQSIFGENFQIVRCKKCGLIHTNPRPTKDWKKRFYDPKYNRYMEDKGRSFVYLPSPKKILRDGGLLFIETPNYLTYYYLKRYFNFLTPIYCKITGRYDLPWGPFDHLFHWTHTTLISALSHSGFEHGKTLTFRNYRSEIPTDRPLSLSFRQYAEMTHRVFRRLGASFDFRPILLVIAKKSIG